MRLQPQLYIDTSGNPLGEPTFERVEFFDFESIEITSTVQDFRDISKVFTDYSKTFNVPASSTNNKIFKHYYNSSIVNGFDARIKQKAEIHINGIFWKTGYVRLTKSLISNGKAKSYSITFFGSLTNLSNVIGNAELSDLSSLNKYNHEYEQLTVYDGFTQGLQLDGDTMNNGDDRDIIYPAISANDKWYYESGTVSDPIPYNQGYSVNLHDEDEDGTYGINWLSLKPAIKIRHIIDAIQEKYSSIKFSNEFFGSDEIEDLYMLLHNNKGVLAPASNSMDDVTVTYRVGTNNSNSDFVLSASNTEARPPRTYWEVPSDGADQRRVFQYHLILDISNTVKSGGGSNPKYTVSVLSDGIEIDRFTNLEGDKQVTSVLCTENVKEWDNLSVSISTKESELSSFELKLDLKFLRYKLPYDGFDNTCDVSNFTSTGGVPVTETSTYSTAVSGTQSMVKTIEITNNMPKMKILDFLQGVFKMFNLTALPNEEGVLEVKTLNKFYSEGNTIDITNKVNTEEISVNRMDLFKNIEFKFADPKTFGIINNNEVSDTDYGNLEYQATADGTDSSLVFDGKDYKIKLPFEKLYYERLFDETSVSSRTEFGHGWLADKDQNEILTKPILFYNIVQPVNTALENDSGGLTGLIGFRGVNNITQYNRPSNTNAKERYISNVWTTVQGTKSINFNTEFDEFTFTEVNLGLFRKYYQNYISSIFNKGTRVFDLEMKADLAFLLKYNINDTLTIKGEEFLINNIRTNLNTGLTKLELVLKFFIEDEDSLVGDTLTTPTGLSQFSSTENIIRFNWNANPIGELVAGYKIYVDDFTTPHATTVGVGTNYSLSGLTINTSYNIKISAYNSQGLESSLTSIVAMNTGVADTLPPTAPTNLRVIEQTTLYVKVEWDASTDNVGVTGYDVYIDNGTTVTTQTSTATTHTITGLATGSKYPVFVRAKDAANNYSAQSNTISVKLTDPT